MWSLQHFDTEHKRYKITCKANKQKENLKHDL
jgi:hypothetical protein